MHSPNSFYSYWSGGVPYYPYDVNPTSGYDTNFTSGGFPYTSPVGSFASNGYGLYDMAGNVYQWCWDWFDYYSSGSQSDPRGPATGSHRVIRGCSWGHDAINCRTAARDDYGGSPAGSSHHLGFRCVLSPGQP